MGSQEKPQFYTGEPVEPCDLQFRDEFIDLIWETLEQRHVLIASPRRTGKTSVMNHLVECPRGGFIAVNQNVQDLSHPAELFQTILENFYEQHQPIADRLVKRGWDLVDKAKNWLAENIESVGAGGFKIALRNSDPDWHANWKQHADEALRQLRSIGKPVLIVVDELPDLILNMREQDEGQLREFLAWFRRQRQSPPPKQDPIRWLIGGSINLASTLDDLGEVDLINDLATETLPILEESQVVEFVRNMLSSRNVEFSQTVPRQVSQRLGRPIPLFMQLVTQELYRHWRKHQRRITKREVEAVFAEMVTSHAAQDKLQHYYSRIRTHYRPPQQSAAYLLLSMLCQSSQDGVSRRQLEQIYRQHLGDRYPTEVNLADTRYLFNQLMRDLENDFYVAECGEDAFDFSSGVMKAWWKKYYA